MRTVDELNHGRLEVIRGCMELLPDGFSMLEIGVCTGSLLCELEFVLERKRATYTGVDVTLALVPKHLLDVYTFVEMDSKQFMDTRADKWDLIFVDGRHDMGAVVDVENAVKHLRRGGMIVIHDVESRSFDDGGPRTGFKSLVNNPRFMCKLFVWDEIRWRSSTGLAIDVDQEGMMSLLNQENKE